jgi:hypothetical protein
MNATLQKQLPQQIRISLHERIDRLPEDELEQMEQQFEVFELKRKLESLCVEFTQDWQSGGITQDQVDSAIQDYRTSHAYVSPGKP